MGAGPGPKGSILSRAPLPPRRMPHVRAELSMLSLVIGATNMQRFKVFQLQEDRWLVMCQGRAIYSYTTEEEAREAAFELAAISYNSGHQASAVILPVPLSSAASRQHPAVVLTRM
jgi:hypothetical protein